MDQIGNYSKDFFRKHKVQQQQQDISTKIGEKILVTGKKKNIQKMFHHHLANDFKKLNPKKRRSSGKKQSPKKKMEQSQIEEEPEYESSQKADDNVTSRVGTSRKQKKEEWLKIKVEVYDISKYLQMKQIADELLTEFKEVDGKLL